MIKYSLSMQAAAIEVLAFGDIQVIGSFIGDMTLEIQEQIYH
jgi:hypothetical protein